MIRLELKSNPEIIGSGFINSFCAGFAAGSGTFGAAAYYFSWTPPGAFATGAIIAINAGCGIYGVSQL